MVRQTVVQPAKEIHKSMCQGVENGLRTSSIERHSRVVQQEELGRMVEEARPVDEPPLVEPVSQQQRPMIKEPVAIPPQPSSSSHEDPMQVNTTPRRATIPEDEDDTRTVRPRLDMSALISELCERDVPEIDWEKLGENRSSVFDIHTGLHPDGAQVKSGP